LFCFFIFCFDKFLLYSLGWLQIHDSPALASGELGWQVLSLFIVVDLFTDALHQVKDVSFCSEFVHAPSSLKKCSIYPEFLIRWSSVSIACDRTPSQTYPALLASFISLPSLSTAFSSLLSKMLNSSYGKLCAAPHMPCHLVSLLHCSHLIPNCSSRHRSTALISKMCQWSRPS
jgi:hypothetical protein